MNLYHLQYCIRCNAETMHHYATCIACSTPLGRYNTWGIKNRIHPAQLAMQLSIEGSYYKKDFPTTVVGNAETKT